MKNVLELLGKIERHCLIELVESYGIVRDLRESPSLYHIVDKSERKEVRMIGKSNIPKIGKIITCVDNDFYEMQTDSFKTKYPELNTPTESVIIERVVNVALKEKRDVILIIERYFIQKKN